MLGVVPKSYLPDYREYYEKRQFRAARERDRRARSQLLGEDVPFGTDLLFAAHRPAAASRCTSRSARTCGCRSRRAPTARWPARRCSRTCRRATSRSARPTTGAAVRGAVRAHDRRLPLHRGRARRVDHRPGLGRPGADLRERRAAGRVRALRGRRAADCRRRRPRPARRPTARSTSSFGDSIARLPRAACGDAPDRLRARRPHASRWRCGAHVERFPYVPADPAEPQRALRGGLQHPGARAGDAAAGDRHREGRDRRLRRAGLDARADRRRPSRWTGSGCRAPTSSPTRCPASRPAS